MNNQIIKGSSSNIWKKILIPKEPFICLPMQWYHYIFGIYRNYYFIGLKILLQSSALILLVLNRLNYLANFVHTLQQNCKLLQIIDTLQLTIALSLNQTNTVGIWITDIQIMAETFGLPTTDYWQSTARYWSGIEALIWIAD